MDTRTDAELIQESLGGETVAFGELVIRYQNAVYATALHHTASFADAQDVAQEAFIEAYKCLHRLREPAKFPSWLYRITQRQCNRWARKNKKATPIEELGSADMFTASNGRNTLPDTALEYKELKQVVQDAIAALPQKVGEVVAMYYIDGLSYDEIASFLSIPKTTAKGRLQMGRKKMRKGLIDMVEDTLKQSRPDEKFVLKVLNAAKENLRDFENRFRLSVPQFQQALDALEKSQIDPAKQNAWRFEAIRGLARAYGSTGRIAESREAYEELMGMAQEVEVSADDLVDFHNGAAEHSLGLGDIEEAERHALAALRGAESLGDQNLIARSHKILGDIAMAQRRWEDAIRHYQQDLDIIYPQGREVDELQRSYSSQIMRSHGALGTAYMKNGDYQRAVDLLGGFDSNSPENWGKSHVSGTLRGHAAMDTSDEFMQFLDKYKSSCADGEEQASLTDWYLGRAEISAEFSHLDFADDFTIGNFHPSWIWTDEFEDCSYRFVDGGGLEIHAANGRGMGNMNLSAPRLMREVSGDFACEFSMLPASDERPQIGGLLVWKNMSMFVRFDRGRDGKRHIWLRACVERKKSGEGYSIGYIVAGSRLLPRDAADLVYMRLERIGSDFSFYCSSDGKNWLKHETMELEIDDPVQIGIYANGTFDRTLYCGEFREGTATLFRDFRLWTRS